MVSVRVAPDQTSFMGHGWVWTTLDMLSELLIALLQSLDKVYSRQIGFHPSSGVGKTLVDVNSFKVNLCQIAFILVLLFIVLFLKQQKQKQKKNKKTKKQKTKGKKFVLFLFRRFLLKKYDIMILVELKLLFLIQNI